MTWREILESDRASYEMKLDHILVRFYQHENGNWCVRIHYCGGMTIYTFDTKREAWDRGRELAKEQAEHDRKVGTYDPKHRWSADWRQNRRRIARLLVGA